MQHLFALVSSCGRSGILIRQTISDVTCSLHPRVDSKSMKSLGWIDHWRTRFNYSWSGLSANKFRSFIHVDSLKAKVTHLMISHPLTNHHARQAWTKLKGKSPIIYTDLPCTDCNYEINNSNYRSANKQRKSVVRIWRSRPREKIFSLMTVSRLLSFSCLSENVSCRTEIV